MKVERSNALWFLDVSHRFAKFLILNGEKGRSSAISIIFCHCLEFYMH